MQRSSTVLLAVLPLTHVFLTIWPCENAISVLTIVKVLPFIPLSISPSMNTMSVHLIVAPLADIFAPIWPSLASLPVYFVLIPFTFVVATISPYVITSTMLQTILISTLVAHEIWPLSGRWKRLLVLRLILRLNHISIQFRFFFFDSGTKTKLLFSENHQYYICDFIVSIGQREICRCALVGNLPERCTQLHQFQSHFKISWLYC